MRFFAETASLLIGKSNQSFPQPLDIREERLHFPLANQAEVKQEQTAHMLVRFGNTARTAVLCTMYVAALYF